MNMIINCVTCGVELESLPNICNECGSVNTELDLETVEIFVPIDFTNLKDNLPPGEIIIYSATAKISSYAVTGYAIEWPSHILCTPKGIAYFNRMEGKDGLVEGENMKDTPHFVPWEETGVIDAEGWETAFLIKGVDYKVRYGITLTFDSQFETKKSFNQRRKEFATRFRPVQLKKKLEWLRENGEKDTGSLNAIESKRKHEVENGVNKLLREEIARVKRELKQLEKERKKKEKELQKKQKK